MAGTGQGGRFSLSGRHFAIEKGIEHASVAVAEKGVGFEGCQQKPTRRDQRRTGQKHLNHGVDDTKAQRHIGA